MRLPYLTKEDSNETFHKEYQKKLAKINEELEASKQQLKSLKLTVKEMDEELEYISGDDKKTIPHFKRKRALKEKIKALEEKILQLQASKTKVQQNDGSMRSWEVMFKKLNIDLTQRKGMEGEQEEELVDPYHSYRLDHKKLNRIKRGFNLLAPPSKPQMNYEIKQLKYNVDALEELTKEYSASIDFKNKAAKEKVRWQAKEEARRLKNLTKTQRYGHSALLISSSHTTKTKKIQDLDDLPEDDSEEDEPQPKSKKKNAANNEF